MRLTETAFFVRRAVVITIILLILLVVGRITINIGKAFYAARYPSEEQPAVLYGRLPKIDIPTLSFDQASTPEYFLETTTGELPFFDDIGIVYKILERKYSLLSEENTIKLAKTLGFVNEFTDLSFSEYYWEDFETKRNLIANIITRNFAQNIDLHFLEQAIDKGSVPPKGEAVTLAENLLKTLDLPMDDYLEGDKVITLVEIKNGSLRQALSLSETQMIKVDFFRSIENIPILGPNPKEGMVQIFVCDPKDRRMPAFPIIKLTKWDILKDDKSTYPLLPVNVAYEKVINGEASIVHLRRDVDDPFVSYTPLEVKTITISNVTLAYYDTENFQKYLQPIYVFQGRFETSDGEEGDYISYVPAIHPEWIAEE